MANFTESSAGNLNDWLLQEGRKCSRISDLLEGVCTTLCAAGINIDRATLGAPLFHPVAQSCFASWSRGEKAKDNWFIWSPDNMEAMRNSPIIEVYEEGRGQRLKLTNPDDRLRYGIGQDLFEQGFIEYITLPLPFSDNSYKVITFATRTKTGFSNKEFELVNSILPALSTALEILVQKNTTKILLDTYVGTRASNQILSGDIHRGDGTLIRAVIWFCDLRAFTQMSQKLEVRNLLKHLDHYFETIVKSVVAEDGEILKFIGDAVLAVFPSEHGALQATRAAMRAAINARNRKKSPDWPKDLDFGIALHLGEVFFGNIGDQNRLDFTVIGNEVNLASRIESLCAELQEDILVSEAFQRENDYGFRSCGIFELKGMAKPVEIYACNM